MKGVVIIKREDYIKTKIKELGFNVKEFAEYIDMPYSTLRSILNQSIGGAAIDNVLKICSGLNISIDDLQVQVKKESPSDESAQSTNEFTPHEQEVIAAYRAKPDMQKSVDRLLGVERDELPDPLDDNVINDVKKMIDSLPTSSNVNNGKSSR